MLRLADGPHPHWPLTAEAVKLTPASERIQTHSYSWAASPTLKKRLPNSIHNEGALPTGYTERPFTPPHCAQIFAPCFEQIWGGAGALPSCHFYNHKKNGFENACRFDAPCFGHRPNRHVSPPQMNLNNSICLNILFFFSGQPKSSLYFFVNIVSLLFMT